MKHRLVSLIILSLLLGWLPELSAQKSKARQKEIEKYWKKEVRLGKSTHHDQVAARYPEIGWLSGLWCKDGQEEPNRHYEILGKWEIRLGTRGFTAEDKKQVVHPKSVLMGEFMDKPVVVENGPFYEFWSYSGDGKGIYGPVWWVFLERIEKVSDTEFKRVYAKSYTHRKAELDLAAFAEEESKKINIFTHYEDPQIYRKCK